jgi:hypothetical protein
VVSVAEPLTLALPIATRCGLRSAGFGIRTSRTPSAKSAATLSASMPSGSVSEREKRP